MTRNIAGLHSKVKNYSRFDGEILKWYKQATITAVHFAFLPQCVIMNLTLKQLRFLIFLLALLPTLPTYTPNSVNAAERADLISLKAENDTLKGVLTKIANDTGYRILLNEEWESTPITIELRNVTLRAALDRFLKGLNYAITWDESKKKISLFICHPGKCSGKMGDVSLSAEETEFVQSTSTLVE